MIDLVVDGNSLFARSWFAAEKQTPDEPAEVVKLVVRTILKLLHPGNDLRVHFNRTFFAWDSEQAKSKNRKPKPPEYHATRQVLKEVLSLMLGTVHHEHPDHEGDDIVATVVHQSDRDDTVYVVSGDKDLQQLQGGNCQFYCLNAKAVLNPAYIVSRFHVKRPNQIAIALAIKGDAVDNIPGIRGWGEAKVKKLFEQVPKTAKFDEALRIIEGNIPEHLKHDFYSSLERTLLGKTVPDVPSPAPIVVGDPEQVASLEIPDIGFLYQQVYDAYRVRD
jgi:DNA polymerase-1